MLHIEDGPSPKAAPSLFRAYRHVVLFMPVQSYTIVQTMVAASLEWSDEFRIKHCVITITDPSILDFEFIDTRTGEEFDYLAERDM